MSGNAYKRAYAVHSALGVVVGLVLFIVVLSGVPALFEDELTSWAHPNLRYPPPEDYDLDTLLAQNVARAPEGTKEAFAFLPSLFNPALRLTFVHSGEVSVLDIHPQTGQQLTENPTGFHRVWRNLHTNALMGRAGRYTVGLAGLAMLLMLASGLLAHRKMFQQLWTWRRDRSFRLSLGDLHKLAGVWGSIFHIMFAFTGAILGLLGLLTIVSALVAYEGDQEAAIAAVLGPPVERSGEQTDWMPVEPILEKARHSHPHVDWSFVRLMPWQDANAHAELSGFRRDAIAMRSTLRFRLQDGRAVHEVDWVEGGPWKRAFGLVTPLHYAQFGGMVVKAVYVLVGLLGALLVASGLVLWLEARRRRASLASHQRLAALTAGVLGGLPMATFVLPWFDRIARSAGLVSSQAELAVAYVVFLVLGVGYAFLRAPGRALRELLIAAGLFALAAPLLDTLLVGPRLAWTASGPAAAVNVVFVVVGLLTLFFVRALPAEVLRGSVIRASVSTYEGHTRASPSLEGGVDALPDKESATLG